MSKLSELIREGYLNNILSNKNTHIVFGRGTPLENYNEFLETYSKFSQYKGSWNSSINYLQGNIVNGAYIAKENIPGTHYQYPDYEMGDTDYWEFIESSETEFPDIWNLDYEGHKDFYTDDLVQIYMEIWDNDLSDYIYLYAKYRAKVNIIINKQPSLDNRWEVYTGEILVPSANNRYTVILNSGYYDGMLKLNVPYVDIVALVDNQTFVHGVKATSNNVKIKGLEVIPKSGMTFTNGSANVSVLNHDLSVGDYIELTSGITVGGFSRFIFKVETIIDNNTVTLTELIFGLQAIPTNSGQRQYSRGFIVGNNLSSLVVENVTVNGGLGFIVSAESIITNPKYISGTYINCKTKGDNVAEWGIGEVLFGTFINIEGYRVSTNGATSGKFENIIIRDRLGHSVEVGIIGLMYHTGNYNNISVESSAFSGRCDGIFSNLKIKGAAISSSTFINPTLIISKGTFYNIICGVFSFAGTYGNAPSATLGKTRFAGKAYNCIMGWGSGGGLTDDAGMDGVMVNCHITQGTTLEGQNTTLPFFKAVKPRACAITVANPAVITFNNHCKIKGDAVRFSSTDTLPTGLLPDTDYYVLATGLTPNSFSVSATPNGTAVETTDAGTGTHSVILGRYVNCIDGTGKIVDTVNN